MKPKAPAFPRVIIVITSILAIAAFFLPYISTTGDYREYLESCPDRQELESIDFTTRDLEDMTLNEYAYIYARAWEEVSLSSNEGMLYTILTGAIFVAAAIMLLTGAAGKPILTLISDILMEAAFLLTNWDIVLRGVMPDSDKVWGIAYKLYTPLAIIIAVAAIWMLVVKCKARRAWKAARKAEG